METRQQHDKGSQNDDFLICPKCGGNTKNLIRHFMGEHPEYGVKNKTDIQNAFPEYKGRFHIDNRKIGDYICPICDTHFDYKNGLQVHIKNLHADQYHLYKRKDIIIHVLFKEILWLQIGYTFLIQYAKTGRQP